MSLIEQINGRNLTEVKSDKTLLIDALQAAGCDLIKNGGGTVLCPFCDDGKKPSAGIYNGDCTYKYK